jgi:23S rRNA (cytosine1962-C5)-methyltransferase
MNATLPTIRLRPREGRRVRAGAPWAFSNEIVMDGGAKKLTPGAEVMLADDKGTPLGAGYFNPKSLIAVRLLGPPGTDLGRDFLATKLRHAVTLRQRLFHAPFYRLVHAEGDALPGLVIDRFGDTCVAQVTTAGMERMTDDMLAALDAVVAPKSVFLRNDTPARSFEGLDAFARAAKGQTPSRLVVEENGIGYLADVATGQKSGWYYDQRDNRAFMAKLAKGARVLDAYCYTGGFGLLAAAMGAAHVTGIDSSEPALKLAAESAEANGVTERCTFIKGDVFAVFERLAEKGERFDIVIADPPPFAPSRKDVEAGARAYRKLARFAASSVAPGGFLMLASCSHNMPPDRFSAECAAGIARAGRTAALIRQAGGGPDHPAHPMLPETAYLKALVYALD